MLGCGGATRMELRPAVLASQYYNINRTSVRMKRVQGHDVLPVELQGRARLL